MKVLTSWLASPLPDAAVEIAPDRVSAATLALRGNRARVQAYASEALPPGTITPSLGARNIADRDAVAGALRVVLGRLGARAARVALVVPDLAAKVSVVRFERVPPRRDDLDQLVRWQIRKSLPFPIEDACVTYTTGQSGADGSEFIVVAARQDVVSEYEEVCAAAGAHAGLVELSTFSVLNLTLAAAAANDQPAGTVREADRLDSAAGRVASRPDLAGAGDWLVVHMRPEHTSIAILRGGNVIFFRNRPEGDEEPLTDVVHQAAMYHQDRLAGHGFRRVLLGGSGRTAGAFDHARQELEVRLAARVEPIDPTAVAVLPDRIGGSSSVQDELAPLAGILLGAASRGADPRVAQGGHTPRRLMLKTNLSTRPFYNLRAVRALLGAVALLVAAVTLFNAVELLRLTASQYALGARAAEAEREATRLRGEAVRIRSEINPQELQGVASAAREANAIIDQRAFSWTDLLTQFEATLPPDVRITTVRPRLERDGTFVVAVGVESRRAEDLDAFIEALETEGGFRNVLSIQEQTNDAGLIQAVIQGSYAPPPRVASAGGGR